MTNIPERLRRALESDCAESMCEIIDDKRPEDFAALKTFLSLDLSVIPNLLTKAIYVLGRWEDPAVVPDIIDILPRLNEEGRITAADALSKLGTTQALEEVVKNANDPSPYVRKIVIRTLGKMGSPDAHKKLEQIAASDPEEWVRLLASKYLQPKKTK